MLTRFDPARDDGPLLVVIPSVAGVIQGDGFFLDDKAISGLALYSRYWPGRVRCIFREGTPAEISFGSWYSRFSLPCEVVVAPKGSTIHEAHFADAAVVLASGDNHLDFGLARRCRALSVPLVFVIEYILETRLQIIALSNSSLIKRLASMIWTVKSEVERRRTFAKVTALQANGTPAARSYARSNPNILTYFDTRLTKSMVASETDLSTKEAKRRAGSSLRLAFSGRLERLKGADHLLPLAELLVKRGIDFKLDIFGAGSLAAPLQEGIGAKNLARYVEVHEPIKFETELIPWMRKEADVFVCCHRQSDPSCTYLETLGCGVPIVAYRNRAIEGILDIADVGWLVRKDDLHSLADKIAELAADREQVATKARAGAKLAMEHSFENTFLNRVEQLRSVALQKTDWSSNSEEKAGLLSAVE